MESELLLEVMRHWRNVCTLENELADARIEENAAVGNLYKFRAERAEKRLEGTEFNLGSVRHSIRKNIVATRSYKCHHASSLSSKAGKYSIHPTKLISHSIH